MKVLILAEYYPRAGDPARGIWAHRQALAARAAGAEVRVLVLHRPLPPLATARTRDAHAALEVIRQPRRAELDGLRVEYLRYFSPPRPWSYDHWGAWAAPLLRRRLNRLRHEFGFELVHAHYAIPAGDAVRRACPATPLLISVHGHDVRGSARERPNVRTALGHAGLVLANSAGTARLCGAHGARRTRVVHLGAPVAAEPRQPPSSPGLISVGDLVERKRHRDVISALGLLRERHPQLRYVIVGDGPERHRLRRQATELNLLDRVEFRGALPHEPAVAALGDASLMVLPSVDEAFGVAYIEAMGTGVPAIGCEGEDGPEEIAAAGEGITLVAPRDPRALAQQIEALLEDRGRLAALGHSARETVAGSFTWERCGQQTVAAYRDLLESARAR
jgi:glycosyltransferase involved in cell wall biosynthesis